jgi:serine/threonine-protein kinase
MRRMSEMLGTPWPETVAPSAVSGLVPPTDYPEPGAAWDMAVPVRTSLPGYEILGELGRGGMGVVYRARHVALNREVAVKMILAGTHAGEEEWRRFLAEAEAVAAIAHAGIVQIHDFGVRDGHPFCTLELCPGGSLAKKLAGAPLPPREAARVVEQVARGVQAAHDKGILHRDLKPGNILLDAAGQPKVADFGLARKLEGGNGLTQTGAVVGTPSYMPPEQALGKKDLGPAADVWALGAVLYECLTGRPPFLAATPYETIIQVVNDEPVPPRHLNAKDPRSDNLIKNSGDEGQYSNSTHRGTCWA